MKLRPLPFINGNHRFYLDKISITEQDVDIAASTQEAELNIRIFIDNVIHFQITDESYKVKLSEYLFENNQENNFKKISEPYYFFEIEDDGYMNWLSEESFNFFEKEYYKAYIFFFSDSIIEIISATEPLFYYQQDA